MLLPREIRATWFTTTFGLDWPSTMAVDAASRKEQQGRLCAQFDQLKRDGINTVLFQVRTRSTAVYDSPYEPWLRELTGSPQRSPGYDPLRFATEEAHKRGMQLHAWVVCYGVTEYAELKKQGRESTFRKHPEWFMKTKKGVFLNPGLPAARRFLADVCEDLAERYDIDGVHLDYIRYPEAVYRFNDRSTYRRYGQGMRLEDWRTENVSKTVELIAKRIKGVKPWMCLSVSCLGKDDDLTRYKAGGWCAKKHAQNVEEWTEKEWVDVVYPMLYADREHYYPFLLDWKERIKKAVVVPGIGLYFLAPEYGNRSLNDLKRQIFAAQSLGMGFAIFRTQFLLDNVKGSEAWLTSLPPAENLSTGGLALRGASQGNFLLPPALKTTRRMELPKPKIKWELRGRRLYATIVNLKNYGYNVYRKDDKGCRLVKAMTKQPTIELGVPMEPLRGIYKEMTGRPMVNYAICFYDRFGREGECEWFEGNEMVKEKNGGDKKSDGGDRKAVTESDGRESTELEDYVHPNEGER